MLVLACWVQAAIWAVRLLRGRADAWRWLAGSVLTALAAYAWHWAAFA